MKKTLLIITLSLFTSALLFTSCKKDDPEPVPNTPVNTTPPIFNWKLNNSISLTSDSTYCYRSITSIFAYKNGNTNSIEIGLSSLNTGSYSISSATGNAFTLVNNNITYNASSGTVNISSIANNKISGTVSVAFTTGTITTLTGEFTDLTQR